MTKEEKLQELADKIKEKSILEAIKKKKEELDKIIVK